MKQRALLLLAGAVLATQLVLAYVYCGFLTGDEVEPLSEAFRIATDYRYESWDARNTFVARFAIAPWIWAATHLGVTSRAALVVIATIPFALATAITILLVHLLTLRWSGDRIAAGAATILFALHWLPLGFGSTTYPRVIAMLCIVGGAALIPRAPWLTGALMGIAFADRYSEAIYLPPLCIAAFRHGGFKSAMKVALGAVLSIAVTSGIYEWILWGSPFHNLRTWTSLTILEGKISARATSQPPWWFLTMLPRWCALTLLPLLWAARRRMFEAWCFFLLPLAALTFISHKELRFLQSVIPFLAILAGAGFAVWWHTRRRLAIALLAISVVWNLWGLRFLGRETKPAVQAARFLATRPQLKTIALGQIWAYGDRIYLGNGPRLIDVGTPLHSLDVALPAADAVAVFASDVTPETEAAIEKQGFINAHQFVGPRSRDVIVFIRRADTAP